MSDENAVPPAPSPRPSNIIDSNMDSTSATHALQSALAAEETKPVRCAKFRQQELWAWKPVWSPRVIVIMYFIIALVFIPLGAVVLVQTTKLFSSPLRRYDGQGCAVGNETTIDTPPRKCTIRLQIDKDVKAPSYFYYGITNFYQNARTYTTSRSDEQLRNASNPSTATCKPLQYADENDSVVLNPCGLVANSQFNDTFRLCKDRSCSDLVSLKSEGIAWDIDRDRRYKAGTTEDFMVWMRLAAYRNWKKLYRIIDEDLPAGNYWVGVDSNYPVSGFGGKKFFFISETTWFGGPNLALAISYLVVGVISLIVSVFFAFRSRMASDIDLPLETTVYLEGLVKHPVKPSNYVQGPQDV